MYAQIKNEGTYTPDALFAGDADNLVCRKFTVASAGQALPRGAVLGKVTAGGKLVLSTAAASDGSQEPYAILADSIPAGAADVEAMAYLTGLYNTAALTFGAGHTAASTLDQLRDRGIHLL